MIVFAEEKFADVWPEFEPLAYAHWKETMQPTTDDEFNPDVESYIRFNESGFYHLYTARQNGELVGDMGIYLSRSMHTQKIVATEDSWYMKPEVRAGRIAKNFVEFVHNELVKLGATSGNVTTPPNAGSRRLLQKMGYQHKADCLSKEFANVFPIAPPSS